MTASVPPVRPAPQLAVTTLRPTLPAPRTVERAATHDRVPEFAVQGALALDLHNGAAGRGLPETPELDLRRSSRLDEVSDAEIRGWAARLAQAVVETVSGERPVSQLVRWTSPEVYRDVERRSRIVSTAGGSSSRLARPRMRPQVRPQVRSVHVCRPAPEAAEVSIHVRHGARSRAVAMRLERHGGRWLCTVLQFG